MPWDHVLMCCITNPEHKWFMKKEHTCMCAEEHKPGFYWIITAKTCKLVSRSKSRKNKEKGSFFLSKCCSRWPVPASWAMSSTVVASSVSYTAQRFAGVSISTYRPSTSPINEPVRGSGTLRNKRVEDQYVKYGILIFAVPHWQTVINSTILSLKKLGS